MSPYTSVLAVKITDWKIKGSKTLFVLLLFIRLPLPQQPLVGQASRSHSDTPQSVRLLWTRDQPDAETST
jgi:hypothetical protein